MKVFRFPIDPELVRKGMQQGGAFLRASAPCPCGCAPFPFVSISDGEEGLTVNFETAEEIAEFKRAVACLD